MYLLRRNLGAKPSGRLRAPRWTLLASVVGLVTLLFVTRLVDLGARPFQYDEAIHATLSYDLAGGSPYRYDPKVHGPVLYYVTAGIFHLFGDSDATARLWPAIAGILLVVSVLASASEIGRPQAWIAAVLLTVSPTILYYSRFLREDVPVAFFTYGMVLFGYRYLRRRRHRDAAICGLFVALALAQKESTILILALFACELAISATARGFRDHEWLGALVRDILPDVALAVGVVIVVYGALFTALFTDPHGLTALFTGLAYWANIQAHPNLPGPWWYYVPVLVVYELPILIAAGLALASPRRDGLRLFLAGWSLGAFVLFSWAQEKVPWLAVHIVLPLALLAGMGLGDAWTRLRGAGRAALASSIALGIAFSLHAGLSLAFLRNNDPAEILVFDPPTDDVLHLVNEIRAIEIGRRSQLAVEFRKQAQWPIDWYLRKDVEAVASIAGDETPDFLLEEYSKQEQDPLFQATFDIQKIPFWRKWKPPWEQASWPEVWRYFLYRKTFGNTETRDAVLAIRKDTEHLVGAGSYADEISPDDVAPASAVGLGIAHHSAARVDRSILEWPR